MSKFPYGVWVNTQSSLDALVRLLPLSPLPSLLSVMETHHSRIPWPWKPRRGDEQRQMAVLAQNNKSSNCPGIFYLIYNSLLSFISSSYITGSFRNDSPEEETVTNEITPSELIGHVTCQLYSYLTWLEMISYCFSDQTGSPAWTTLRRPPSCVPEKRKWNTLVWMEYAVQQQIIGNAQNSRRCGSVSLKLHKNNIQELVLRPFLIGGCHVVDQ